MSLSFLLFLACVFLIIGLGHVGRRRRRVSHGRKRGHPRAATAAAVHSPGPKVHQRSALPPASAGRPHVDSARRLQRLQTRCQHLAYFIVVALCCLWLVHTFGYTFGS